MVESSGTQFTTSFDRSSLNINEDVDEIFFELSDTKIETRYVESDKPVSLNIEITNIDESESINRDYNYSIPENGTISIDRSIKLHEFDPKDFSSDRKTDLEFKFTVDHPDFEDKVRKNTVSIDRTIDTTSCKTILESDSTKSSGFYEIQPDGFSSSFNVYCDMDTRGGGWTAVWRNAAGPSRSASLTNSQLWSSDTSTTVAPFEISGDFSSEKNVDAWDYSVNDDGGEWLKTIRDYDDSNNLLSVSEGSSDGYNLGTPTDVVLDLGSGVSFSDFVGTATTRCKKLNSQVTMIRYYNGGEYNHGSTDYVGSIFTDDPINIGFASSVDNDDCGASSGNLMDSWVARHVISYRHDASTDYNIVRCQFECWDGTENRIKETTWFYRSGAPDV